MISAQIQTIAFFLRTFLSSFIPKWNSYSYHELLSKKKKKKKIIIAGQVGSVWSWSSIRFQTGLLEFYLL